MEVWIPITIGAAFLQNLRSMLQKRAVGTLSVNGATYIRFCYALPFVWLYLTYLGLSRALPEVSLVFLLHCLVAGMAQILGTSFLIASFAYDKFAVGTTFSKTEVALTALFGFVVLEDTLGASEWAGIAVSFFGVALMSARGALRDLFHGNRALMLGMLAGAGFAIAAVNYRAAALSLPAGDFLIRASLTLAVSVTLQTIIMGGYLLIREPGEIARVVGNWRSAVWVGLLGGAASAAWFSAMTLVNAGLVRALGQVELLFAFLASIWFFKESVSRKEISGALLVVVGIYLLLYDHGA